MIGGFVQEQILHDNALHAAERCFDVLCVRVGLGEILALDVHAFVVTGNCGIEHIGNTVYRLRVEFDTPDFLERCADLVVLNRAIPGKLVRERAHVAGALYVVLPAQRIEAAAGKTEIAGRHREIGHAHDHVRALAVLGDAEPIIDGAIFLLAVQARGIANDLGGHAGDPSHGLGGVFQTPDQVYFSQQPLTLAA